MIITTSSPEATTSSAAVSSTPNSLPGYCMLLYEGEMPYLSVLDELSLLKTGFLWAIASGAVLLIQSIGVDAQQLMEVDIDIEETITGQPQQPLPLEKQPLAIYDSYILGPGDVLQVELLDLPELSGNISVGPDGTLYLPRLRALYVEGLTIEELRYFLTQQYSTYVRDPQVYVRPVAYRPIRIYIGGEVKRPGYYTLSGVQTAQDDVSSYERSDIQQGNAVLSEVVTSQLSSVSGSSISATLFPTVFDAIRTAQGITPFSNLSQVQVTRKRAQGLGGGSIRTNLDFLSLITDGNESQNIRLFDDDVVSVSKSNVMMREQLLIAGQTNLTPQFMSVFVSGRVKNPGRVTLPQGSVLNQALSLAGGPQLLRGKVEFIRFTREGEIDRRIFKYKPGAAANSQNNPVLMAGDLINVNESILSAGVGIMNELTAPVIGLYSVYSLFNDFN